MRIEREMTITNVPLWYAIAVHGSALGIVLGTAFTVALIGWWGLLVLALTPLILLFRFVEFEKRSIRIRIADSFGIIEHDRVLEIPFSDIKVRERKSSILEVSFHYKEKRWSGIVAHKDGPASVLAASDEPALYARIRATLRSR